MQYEVKLASVKILREAFNWHAKRRLDHPELGRIIKFSPEDLCELIKIFVGDELFYISELHNAVSPVVVIKTQCLYPRLLRYLKRLVGRSAKLLWEPYIATVDDENLKCKHGRPVNTRCPHCERICNHAVPLIVLCEKCLTDPEQIPRTREELDLAICDFISGKKWEPGQLMNPAIKKYLNGIKIEDPTNE